MRSLIYQQSTSVLFTLVIVALIFHGCGQSSTPGAGDAALPDVSTDPDTPPVSDGDAQPDQPGEPTTASVSLKVTVPYWTPASDTIYVTGTTESFGGGTDPRAVELNKVGDWTWEGYAELPVGEDVTIWFTRGSETSRASETVTLTVAEQPRERFEAVSQWNDLVTPVRARAGFVSIQLMMDFPAPGIVTDWWGSDGDESYWRLLETYRAARAKATCDWVSFPEAPWYKELDPLPMVVDEDASAGMRLLTVEEFTRIVSLAGQEGLRYMLHAGNPGPTRDLADRIGSDNPFAWIPANIDEKDVEWWDRWFDQWGDYLQRQAARDEVGGVEILSIGHSLDYALEPYNDARWQALIQRLREVFSGKLTYFFTRPDEPASLSFPSQLDYIGVMLGPAVVDTTDPTIDELIAGITMATDPVPRDVPVIFWLTWSSIDGTASGVVNPDILESTDQLTVDFQEQADCYEAFFRVMEANEWIAGFASWNYAYDDDYFFFPFPGIEDDARFTSSIRNKPAEAVVRKWSNLFRVAN